MSGHLTGVAQFLFSPILGQMLRRYDLRVMIFCGLMLFAFGTWQMTFITRDFDFWELFWPQVLRAIGLMLAMVPANNIALGTLPPELMRPIRWALRGDRALRALDEDERASYERRLRESSRSGPDDRR